MEKSQRDFWTHYSVRVFPDFRSRTTHGTQASGLGFRRKVASGQRVADAALVGWD